MPTDCSDQTRTIVESVFKMNGIGHLDSTGFKYVKFGKDVFEFDGKEYDVFDLDLSYRDWLALFVKYCITRNEVEPKYGYTVFGLMRQDDLDNIEGGLRKEFETCTVFDECLFRAGLYDQVLAQGEENRKSEVEPPQTFIGSSKLCRIFRKENIVGNSSSMIDLYDQISSLGLRIHTYQEKLPNILVVGDRGTGKELMAKAIHKVSSRKGEFRAFNCSAIPKDLLESQLFGVEKGAFTEAKEEKKGIFEVCDGGTVFLDEIGKMSLEHQPKLLRLLQEKEIRRVGSTQPIKVDVLCVSATNEDLYTKGNRGEFALDLLDRISSHVLKVPCLEDRGDDIPLLVSYFLQAFPGNPLDEYRFPLAFALSRAHRNPGNVRVMEDKIDNLVTECLEPGNSRSTMSVKDRERLNKLRCVVENLRENGGHIKSKTAFAEKAGVPRDALYRDSIKNYVERWKNEGFIE
jgi:transcriptional regulator with GAF, ATPase, and Fis domain